MEHEPQTLQEAIRYFSDPNTCLEYMAAKRWPNGVVCPTCGSTKVGFLAKQRRWQCSNRHPKRQFSIKVGTIFADSPLGLDKWLIAMWMLANCKNGVSSYEIHRAIGVTQKTAWFMLHRLRLVLQDKDGGKLAGEVEADETFIGGKARNMHKDKRERRITGTGGKDKTIAMGILQRKGKVKTAVLSDRKKKTVQKQIRKHVQIGSALYTDELLSYDGLKGEFVHNVINHAECYVNGAVHTNGMENFWSLLKRGLRGTYVSVEPFHLFRYLDEQAFRFNFRKDKTDGNRFQLAASQIAGKRLTYAEVTGKVGTTTN